MPFDKSAFVYRLTGSPRDDGPFLVCFRDITTEVFTQVDVASVIDRHRADGAEEIVSRIAHERWLLLEALHDYQQLRQPLISYKTEPSRN